MSGQIMMPVYRPSAETSGLGGAANHMWRAGRRYKWLFISCFSVVLLAGLAGVHTLKPRYTATATVALTSQGADPLAPIGTPSTDQLQDDDLPSTVAAAMQSRDIAAAVLSQFPPAAETASAHGLLCRLHLKLLCRQPAMYDAATRQEAQLENFLKSLTVTPEPHSHIIDVNVSAPSAARAALLANAVVQNYQRISLAQQAAQQDHIAGWLDSRTDALRQQWFSAVKTAEDYSVANHLLATSEGSTTGLIDRQIDAIAVSLDTAEAELATAQAQAGAPQGGAAGAPPESSTAAQASGPLLQLQSERDELATEFGPNYPKIKALNSEIGALRLQVRAGAGETAASANDNLRLAEARVQELNTRLTMLEAEASAQSAPQAEYLSLTAEANSAHAAYEAFLEHADDESGRATLLEPPVSVVSDAGIPLRPAFPDTPKLGLGVLFLALVASAGAVLLRDFAAGGFSEAEDLRDSAQLPLLASFPLLRVRSGSSINLHVLDEPFSRTSEAVRGIAARLSLLAPDQNIGRTVLLTSAGAHEGKSTLAVWLAMTVSQTGQKVLLIDGDHRRGSLMQDEHTARKPGLTDLLAGRARLRDIIHEDIETNVDYIAAGIASPRSFGARDITRLRNLLTNLKQSYSLIVIDSPPLLAMVDGLVLASVVDQTVFLCRWEHTSRQAVTVSLDRLRTYGAQVCGIVVTMVGQGATLAFEGEYSRRESKLINRLYGS